MLLQITCIFLPAFVSYCFWMYTKRITALRTFSEPIYAPWLGKEVTYREILTALIGGIFAGACLYIFRKPIIQILPNYSDFFNLYTDFFSSMLLGGWLGLGGIIGSTIKGFLIQKFGTPSQVLLRLINAGSAMLGSIILLLPWYNPGIVGIIYLLLLAFFLSFLAHKITHSIRRKYQH